MNDTGITRETRSAPAVLRERHALSVALWALQTLLALVFAMAGLAKVFGDAAMVEILVGSPGIAIDKPI